MAASDVRVDTLTQVERSKRMSLIRSKDTGPETTVRSLVYGMGYRYRLYDTSIPGKPDMVFKGRKKVIFVHGCFWHRHKRRGCPLARLPKTRIEFWLPKLEGNRLRDLRNKRELHKLGWSVLEIWECELKNLEALSSRILYFLNDEIA